MAISTRFIKPLLLLSALVLMGQATAPAKLAIPPEAGRAEALLLIQKLFKDDYAGKAVADKANLGRRLLQEARATLDNATARYVLLDQAAVLAAEGGDPETLGAAMDLLDAGYVINALPRRAHLLNICSIHVRGAAVDKQVALTFALMDQAVALNDFALAARMADIAEESASRKLSVAYSATLHPRLRDFRTLEEDFKLAQVAAKTLLTTDDPAAHLIVGRFQALGKGNFSGGLPHLAKGSDAALAAAAGADLANPTTTDAQVKLGDVWWSIAELQTGYRRSGAAARAQHWYRLAKETITGLTLTKINSRLGEGQPPVPGAPPVEPAGVDILSLVDAEKDAVAGDWKRAGDSLVVSPEKYNRLQLPIRAPDEYDLHIRFVRTEVMKNNEGTLAIMLTYKDRAFDLALQASGGTARFEAVNKTAVKDNPTIVPLKLENNVPYFLTISVRKTGVSATLDGKLLTEHKTDFTDLSVYASWKLKDTTLLGVGANSAGARFDKIELVPITGQARILRAPK